MYVNVKRHQFSPQHVCVMSLVTSFLAITSSPLRLSPDPDQKSRKLD